MNTEQPRAGAPSGPLADRGPAIVVAAFGSSGKGAFALDLFQRRLRQRFGEVPLYRAYTSRVISRKTGVPTVGEALAEVARAGHRQAVLLPLQLFPGSEYRAIVAEAERHPGLAAMVGEPLMYRWRQVEEVLGVVEADFLPPGEGQNLLVLHGTPLVADPVNSAYGGVAELVAGRYANVLTAALEGIPRWETAFAELRKRSAGTSERRLRLLPLMFTAGMHVARDLMGDGDSWRLRLAALGFEVECLTSKQNGEDCYKSLAAYAEIHDLFLDRLAACLDRLG